MLLELATAKVCRDIAGDLLTGQELEAAKILVKRSAELQFEAWDLESQLDKLHREIINKKKQRSCGS